MKNKNIGERSDDELLKEVLCSHQYIPEINYSGKGEDVECSKCGKLWIAWKPWRKI
jgi:hypothetical protein